MRSKTRHRDQALKKDASKKKEKQAKEAGGHLGGNASTPLKKDFFSVAQNNRPKPRRRERAIGTQGGDGQLKTNCMHRSRFNLKDVR